MSDEKFASKTSSQTFIVGEPIQMCFDIKHGTMTSSNVMLSSGRFESHFFITSVQNSGFLYIYI